jgi:hypothetical protein
MPNTRLPDFVYIRPSTLKALEEINADAVLEKIEFEDELETWDEALKMQVPGIDFNALLL